MCGILGGDVKEKKKRRTKTKHSCLTTMAKCDSEGPILSFEGAEDNYTDVRGVLNQKRQRPLHSLLLHILHLHRKGKSKLGDENPETYALLQRKNELLSV